MLAGEAREDDGLYRSYLDVSRMTRVEDGVYQAFLRGVEPLIPALGKRVAMSAIVHSGTLGSAATAGYSQLLGSPWPVSVHTTPESAFNALGCEYESESLRTQLVYLLAHMAEAVAIEERVRQAVAHDLTLDLAGCARLLGMSSRTLQRRLGERSHRFRSISEGERLAVAQRLLATTDASVLSVALEVGYSKVQTLAAAFRRKHGVSPTEWRLFQA